MQTIDMVKVERTLTNPKNNKARIIPGEYQKSQMLEMVGQVNYDFALKHNLIAEFKKDDIENAIWPDADDECKPVDVEIVPCPIPQVDLEHCDAPPDPIITAPHEQKAPELKLIKLDLGCGRNRAEGFTGVDKVALPTVDIVHDLDVYPWPFDSGSVDEIRCFHFIEHVDNLIGFMNECYRILKLKATMTVVAPYYTAMGCWQDPTHKHGISEGSFYYYNKNSREQMGVDHYPIIADFDFVYGYYWNAAWGTRSEDARAFAAKHYNNVVDAIQVVLTKK